MCKAKAIESCFFRDSVSIYNINHGNPIVNSESQNFTVSKIRIHEKLFQQLPFRLVDLRMSIFTNVFEI